MPSCWAGAGEDHEVIMNARKPTLHDDGDIVEFDSPVPGHAVALEGIGSMKGMDKLHKNQDIEDMMAFLDSSPDNADAEKEFVCKDVDGSSTLYDSTSEASDDFSTDMSDGEIGPQDLVVVGHSLLRSGSASSVSSSQAQETEENGTGKAPKHQRCKDRLRPDDWWNEVDVAAVPGLEEAPELTTLLEARVIKGQRNGKAPAPWMPGQSSELYTAMGMVDPSKCYVAVWLNLGAASLLFVLELKEQCQDEWLKTCSESNFLSQRLKFISNPVKMRGALPSKPLKDAEAVGPFFGQRSTSCSQAMTDAGVPFICIQVDVFSKWYVKVAFQQVALRLGNIIELVFVDGPSTSVLAGCRLSVTSELLEQLAA